MVLLRRGSEAKDGPPSEGPQQGKSMGSASKPLGVTPTLRTTMGVIETPVHLQRHRVTVEDYHLMAEVGILAPDARVELIDGEVIDMAPMNSRHASMVRKLERSLGQAAGDEALVSCQLPLRLLPRSEPEPDLVLLRFRADFYEVQHPEAADVLLLVEVSDSSLAYDLRVKLPLYARHGVPEVWIVDLENRQVRMFREPVSDHYAQEQVADIKATVGLYAAPRLSVNLSGLFSANR
jgi:Uma2 family endonuclease